MVREGGKAQGKGLGAATEEWRVEGNAAMAPLPTMDHERAGPPKM